MRTSGKVAYRKAQCLETLYLYRHLQSFYFSTLDIKTTHSTCPVCGNGNVRIVPNDDWGSSGPGRYVCDYCDWESNGQKYYYKSDLGDKDAFNKEVKYLKKVRDCKDGVQKADDTFKAAVELLTATRDKALKGI